MYGEVIIEQLNNPALFEEDNEGRKFLLGTIGAWLDNYDSHQKDMLLLLAQGEYLDAHGREYDVFRKEEEDDDTYRERILLKKHLRYSTDSYLDNGVDLWVYINNLVEAEGSGLTSKNTYIDNHYLAHTTPEKKQHIQKTHLSGDTGVVEWI